MRSVIILLSIVLISCKSPSVKKDTEPEFVLGNIETDTLFSDIYAWPYFVTPEENVYFIKKNNTLFLDNDLIGNIPIILGAERFVISKDYIAFTFIDTTFANVVNIYSLKDQLLIKKIDNSFAVDALYEENSFIIDKDNTERLEVYSVKIDNVAFRFSEYENRPFVSPSRIYTYNALRLKDENGQLIVNSYDKSTFIRNDELIIGNPQGRMVVAFLKDCYVAAKGNTIFLVDFHGKDINTITLATNNKYQTIVTGENRVSFYYWDADIGDEFGDFNFLRQNVSIVNQKVQN